MSSWRRVHSIRLRSHGTFLEEVYGWTHKKLWPFSTGQVIGWIQKFLGLANFYHHFIPGFSSITAPLTPLTDGASLCLTLTKKANSAFEKIKKHFTIIRVLALPDPNLPFIVHASHIGVGAMSSQRAHNKDKIHP